VTKIFKNDQLIWDSETRPKHNTGDAKSWLNWFLTEQINNIENFVLPVVNFCRTPAENAIEEYNIKIKLLQKVQEFDESEEKELYIDFSPYNPFSGTTIFRIEEI
jgi:hypothetical protein